MLYLTKNYKSPYYQVIYSVNGRRTTISTRERKKSDALKFMTQFVESLKPTHSKNKQISLKDYYEKYLEYARTSKSEKYIKSISLSFRVLFKTIDKNMILQDLSVERIDSFIRVTSKTAKRGINVYLRTLKAAFSKAVDWDYLNSNPFSKVKLIKLPKNNDTILSLNDLENILSVDKNDIISDIIEFAFFTGMRLGEILNLKNKSIDFQNKIIRVENDHQYNLKSKTERIIPMSKRVIEILGRRCSNNISNKEHYVFGKLPNVKFSDSWISHSFKKLIRKSKLDDALRFHSLRHSFCSNLVKNNVNLRVVMQLAGHQDFSTSLRYSHLQNEDLIKAINSFDKNI